MGDQNIPLDRGSERGDGKRHDPDRQEVRRRARLQPDALLARARRMDRREADEGRKGLRKTRRRPATGVPAARAARVTGNPRRVSKTGMKRSRRRSPARPARIGSTRRH